ncbi:MAG: YggT family protein [Clostridiaceae bacterium]|nr:YggT family protein [Clostridiaceae bacterium]
MVRNIAYLLLSILQILMLIMAVMSWIPQFRTNRIYQGISLLLEPLLMPIRKLLWRIPALRSFPLDLSFLILWLLISLIQQLL